MPLTAEDDATAFPFSLAAGREAALVGLDLGLVGAGVYADTLKPAPSAGAAAAAAIPWFDGLYVTTDSPVQGAVSDGLMVAAAALPVAALAPGLNGGALATTAVMYAETLGLSYE